MEFFKEGFFHITDLEGYDHMLFLFCLAAGLYWQHWRKLVAMATAFTVGHSITLAMSVLDMVAFSSDLIELLIPTTILITAIVRLIRKEEESGWPVVLMVGLFGLIHGLGFSTYLKMMISDSQERVGLLFFFNLGVEAGQLAILAVLLSLNTLGKKWFGEKLAYLKGAELILAIGFSLFLIIQKVLESTAV